MTWYVKYNNAWKIARDIEVPVDGAFSPVEEGWTLVGSEWKRTYQKEVATYVVAESDKDFVEVNYSFTLTARVYRSDDNSQITDTGYITWQWSTDGINWYRVGIGGAGNLAWVSNFEDGTVTFTINTSEGSSNMITSPDPFLPSTPYQYRALYRDPDYPFLESESNAVSVPTTGDTRTTVTIDNLPSTMVVGTTYELRAKLGYWSGLANKPIELTVSDGYAATAVTNSSGIASFSWTPTTGGAKTFTFTFEGDLIYRADSVSDTRTVSLLSSSVALTASSTSPRFSDSVTLTATVAGGAARSVAFQYDNAGTWTTAATVTTNASNVATYAYATPAANRSWRAVVAETSTHSSVTSTTLSLTWATMPVSVTLTASRANQSLILSTNSTTFTATAVDANGVSVTPTSVVFSRKVYGSTYSTVATDTTSPFQYTATVSESYAVQAAVASWSGYSAATSNTMVMYVYETSTATASATRSYIADGSLRYANETTQIYHGYYDSTNGDQKGAIWFSSMPWSRINNSFAVTQGAVGVVRTGSGGNSANTTFYIGTHTDSTVRSNWANITGKSTQTQSTVLDWNQSANVSMGSTMRNAFRDGAKGIVIGPSGSTSLSFYGILNGGSSPSISLTYYMDPTI